MVDTDGHGGSCPKRTLIGNFRVSCNTSGSPSYAGAAAERGSRTLFGITQSVPTKQASFPDLREETPAVVMNCL
jgi:hypothetical protein